MIIMTIKLVPREIRAQAVQCEDSFQKKRNGDNFEAKQQERLNKGSRWGEVKQAQSKLWCVWGHISRLFYSGFFLL